MEGSWLDHIPNAERMKLRRRLRSPEAYERLRERVKGPEDLERELKRSEVLAELKFQLETEPALQESLQKQVEKDIGEKGIEGVIDAGRLSPELRHALEQGTFTVTVSQHPRTYQDTISVQAEGNIQNKLPLKIALHDQYVQQFLTR